MFYLLILSAIKNLPVVVKNWPTFLLPDTKSAADFYQAIKILQGLRISANAEFKNCLEAFLSCSVPLGYRLASSHNFQVNSWCGRQPSTQSSLQKFKAPVAHSSASYM